MSRLVIVVALLGALIQSAPIAAVAASPPASSALLVGVNDYVFGNLAEPENDVRQLEKALDSRSRRKFETEVLLGSANRASREQILAGWRQTLHKASRGKGPRSALFYFAGHAIERGGRNYLLPGGLRIEDPTDEPEDDQPVDRSAGLAKLLQGSVPLADIISIAAEFQSDDHNRELVIIIIVDACRDDPFPHFNEPNSNSKDEGLGSVNLTNRNIFIMYSAGIGQLAADQSAFARAVVAEINKDVADSARPPSLTEFAQNVRSVVVRKSMQGAGWQQLPAFYHQIEEPRTISGRRIERQHVVAHSAKIDVNDGTLTHRDSFIECDGCPEMVLIERRSFSIGSPHNEDGRNTSYEKQAAVAPDTSQRYAIGRTEVTNAQWLQCASDEKSKHRCRPLGVALRSHELQRPVTGVTHKDARTFAGWLSDKTGQDYRLPSEAEWEFAARGGNAGAYSFVNPEAKRDRAAICDYANGADDSVGPLSYAYRLCSDRAARHTSAVQSYRPNAYGLHDMHGNAWEWVADCWFDTYAEPKITWRAREPADGAACAYRVARGGSWRTGLGGLRSANRNRFAPGEARATLGFRLARAIRSQAVRDEGLAKVETRLTDADTGCPEDHAANGECFFAERYPEDLIKDVTKQRRAMRPRGVGGIQTRGLWNASFIWPVHAGTGKGHIDTLNVCFSDGDDKSQTAAKTYIGEWLARAEASGGLIPVRFLGACASGRNDQHIRISFAGSFSYSAIGWQSMTAAIKSRPSMVIGVPLAGNWQRFKRVVIHEFGHALGLEHEHQNRFANCWAKGYRREPLIEFMVANNWNRETAKKQLRVLHQPGIVATAFDQKSVMLYSFPKRFYVKGSNCYYPTHSKISDDDAELIARLYPSDRTKSAALAVAVNRSIGALLLKSRWSDSRSGVDHARAGLLEDLFAVREGLTTPKSD